LFLLLSVPRPHALQHSNQLQFKECVTEQKIGDWRDQENIKELIVQEIFKKER
jgi:hypothetical protein